MGPVVNLTRNDGNRSPGRADAVLKREESRDGVSVMRVTLASAKKGTSRSGSAAAPRGGRKRGTPARRGENTSATKSTKQEGVRLRFSSTVGYVVGMGGAMGGKQRVRISSCTRCAITADDTSRQKNWVSGGKHEEMYCCLQLQPPNTLPLLHSLHFCYSYR